MEWSISVRSIDLNLVSDDLNLVNERCFLGVLVCHWTLELVHRKNLFSLICPSPASHLFVSEKAFGKGRFQNLKYFYLMVLSISVNYVMVHASSVAEALIWKIGREREGVDKTGSVKQWKKSLSFDGIKC